MLNAECAVSAEGRVRARSPRSSLAAGKISLAAPLAPGASINLQFLLGVEQKGTFRIHVNVEALP